MKLLCSLGGDVSLVFLCFLLYFIDVAIWWSSHLFQTLWASFSVDRPFQTERSGGAGWIIWSSVYPCSSVSWVSVDEDCRILSSQCSVCSQWWQMLLGSSVITAAKVFPFFFSSTREAVAEEIPLGTGSGFQALSQWWWHWYLMSATHAAAVELNPEAWARMQGLQLWGLGQ